MSTRTEADSAVEIKLAGSIEKPLNDGKHSDNFISSEKGQITVLVGHQDQIIPLLPVIVKHGITLLLISDREIWLRWKQPLNSTCGHQGIH